MSELNYGYRYNVAAPGHKRNTVAAPTKRVYDNKQNQLRPILNQRSKSDYFEFKAEDQQGYSYGKDTENNIPEGSNGTVLSTYALGRVGYVKNNSVTNNTYSPQKREPRTDLETQFNVPNLSESNRSSVTTYDQIREPDVSRSNEQGNTKPRSCASRRVILIIAIIVVLIAAGVLVYMFVFRNQPSAGELACISSPQQVLNGHVSELNKEEDIVTVTCDRGHELNGSRNVKCVDGRWDDVPTCEAIKCGPYPPIPNAKIHEKSWLFESTANIVCDSGFVLEKATTFITCLEDGNWSSTPGCVMHPCGIYTPPDDMAVIDELMTVTNMTLCLECKPGLRFVTGTDPCVTCQNGGWTGSQTCEIPGTVHLEPHMVTNIVLEGMSLKCVVQEAPEWQSIVVARSDFEGLSIEPLFHLQNMNDEIIIDQLSNASTFHVSHKLTADGVEVLLDTDHSLCEDAGVYICGNIVGAIDSPSKVKYANATVHLIDITPSIHEIQVPETMYDGIETSVRCRGDTGVYQNGTSLGYLMMQIKYKDTDLFTNLSSVVEDSQSNHCRVTETIVSTIKPTSDMDGAHVRCVVLTYEGVVVASAVKSLTIISPQVTFSTWPSSVFTFGENANITSTMSNINGWDLIEVRKRCDGSDNAIAYFGPKTVDEPIITEGDIDFITEDVSLNAGNLVVIFNPVKCSDTCSSSLQAVYVIAIRIDNATWIENSSVISFQRQPEVPHLELPNNIVAGKSGIFTCTGEIGEPKGYLEIESAFESEIFSVFLSSKDGKDSNAVGSIINVWDESGNCGNKRNLNFQIFKLSSKFHQKLLRCVSRPSGLLIDGQLAVSDVKAIEIIPENHCSQPDGFTGVHSHPFHCNLFVSCHSGLVVGVPAGCQLGDCFQGFCSSCEDIGGCSVTDIYIDNFSDLINLGDAVTLKCLVKDFEGLTNITIYKVNNGNSVVISSFPNDGLQSDFTGVDSKGYLNATSGLLTLSIDSVLCKDEGLYRCVPGGSGKHSKDETTLVLTDAQGNTLC